MSGSPNLALAAIDEAVTAAGPHAPPMLRTWLFNLRADEHAVQGHERQSHDDLDEADRAFAHAGQPGGFFQHWGVQRQARFRGGCEVLLGRLTDGVSILEAVRADMSPDLVGPYVTTTAGLAAASCTGGDL